MDVRVWGMVDDRLIEVRSEPATRDAAFHIEGLPGDRARVTADRVRAALINAGLVEEAPALRLILDPPVRGRSTSEIDLPIALAALSRAGRIGAGLRWILATGRLGLDGEVFSPNLPERVSLLDVVGMLCRTPCVESELMFEKGEP